ncbi:MAG: efflux RND transporter periplasmic adaptor subunit [Lactobacillus sp.]|jgi:membrane fusion protein (multidrug efflux system)|nr:efflux RND transporter periplasmic adaptor subunit [Lactobacillus sp.]
MNMVRIQKREITKKIVIIVILVSIGWWLKGRFTPNMMAMMAGAQGEPHVLIQKVDEQEILPSKSHIGIVEAIRSVDLRPQITGYVEKVLFQEGGFVNEGDILFVIEQERYQATVELRTAELKKAQAHLYQVDKEYKRQLSLNKQKYASEQKLDTAKSDLLQAEASVKQAKANLDLAKIDLNYTVIKAPISGYIGKALVTDGNYVNSSTQVLARIVQVDPIRVVFSMTDKDFLDARKNFDHKEKKLRSRIILPNGDIIDNNGNSHFTNNEANTSTATIASYIEYENKGQFLIPGNYVNVLIGAGDPANVLLIPQAALAQDEVGTYVYVVNSEGVAEQKRVTLGEVYDKRQIVTEGLTSLDYVVIKGQQKIADGQKVKADIISTAKAEVVNNNPKKDISEATKKLTKDVAKKSENLPAIDEEIIITNEEITAPDMTGEE